MSKIERDEEREYRIDYEAVVDAYDAEERSMGWYYYLDDKIAFPFKAKCIEKRSTSPLLEGEEVEILNMASAEECEREMFVTVRWQNRELDVPLAQLDAVDGDEETQEAVGDWHYWVAQGYEF